MPDKQNYPDNWAGQYDRSEPDGTADQVQIPLDVQLPLSLPELETRSAQAILSVLVTEYRKRTGQAPYREGK